MNSNYCHKDKANWTNLEDQEQLRISAAGHNFVIESLISYILWYT
jgi:hypothetical protein